MEQPVYVTNIAERKPQYKLGIRVTIDFPSADVEQWYSLFNKKSSFTFMHDTYFKQGTVNLFIMLQNAVRRRDAEQVITLLPRIEELCQKNYEDLAPLEKWAQTAVQLPGDIGGPKKEEVRNFITSRASGRVLETMCGFNSYFSDSEEIIEVVALDFCREMLERYPYPTRTRILFDLERVVKGEQIGFFPDGSFQTIGCWGSNYLSKQVPVFAEFRRILAKEGRLLILENTTEGYTDLLKRYFDPEKCAKNMEKAGLEAHVTPLPWLKARTELGDYFLVEGKN